MRDTDRIVPLLTKLQTYWKANPDLRLGQIVSNATQAARREALQQALDGSVEELAWSDTLRQFIFHIEDDEILAAIPSPCAACGKDAEGEYGIHRDGFGEGPEVPLCNGCGSKMTPTCEDLWASIAERGLYGDR